MKSIHTLVSITNSVLQRVPTTKYNMFDEAFMKVPFDRQI